MQRPSGRNDKQVRGESPPNYLAFPSSALSPSTFTVHFHRCLSRLEPKLEPKWLEPPTTYVDNINFTAHTSTQWAAAFEVTRVFMDVWSMQIDWRKTWVWANGPHLRKFLESFPELRELYPDQIPLLDSAQELGVARIYNQRPSPSALHARVGKGVSRAKRIPRTLTFVSDRAKLVQKAIWPLALYGAESQYLSSKEMQRLRRAACSAVVGPWHQACDWIACSFLFLLSLGRFTILTPTSCTISWASCNMIIRTDRLVPFLLVLCI